MLRLLQREPFQHLIIGGLWETLPQFESRLHRYLRDRIVARWDIDVHTPTQQVLERVRQEEQQFLQHQAQDAWKAIQDHRPPQGADGAGGIVRSPLAAAGPGAARGAGAVTTGIPLLGLRAVAPHR